MTAIGFLMFVIGTLWIKVRANWRDTWEDYVSLLLFFFGIALMLAGVTVWLWRVAP